MSSTDMNETTLNLIKALKEYTPAEIKPIIIKLIYDKETGIVNGFTMEDTDEPWIEISKEQFDAGIHYKKLRVVNNKLEEIIVDNPKKLLLESGNKWYTKEENMLIMGNERGWDERRNS